MKKISFALAILFVSLASTAQAQTKPFGDQVGLFLLLKPALNIGFDNESNTDTYFSFQGGLGAAYFFHQHIGFELGTDIIQRSFESGGLGGKAFAADIYGGPTFAWAGFLGDGGRSHFHLGGFYSIPFADYETDILDAEKFFGLKIAGDTLFAINEQFSLGFGTSVKFGLQNGVSSPLEAGGAKFYEVAFGLTTTFQPMVQYTE